MSKVKYTEDYKDHHYKKQVILDYIANKISRKTASIKLHTSGTYISTLKKRYLSDGDSIFVHGNKGKADIRKLPAKVEGEICELYKTIYYDFNFQHFCDYTRKSGELSCLGNYEISDRGITRILNRHGTLSPSHRRPSKEPQQHHPVRPRRDQFGELVRIDTRSIPDHNKRCGKPPSNPVSVFRPLTKSEVDNLDTILACHHTRRYSKWQCY